MPNAELVGVIVVVVAAFFTVYVTPPEVLVEKLLSPEYFAVKLSEPTGRLATDAVATPRSTSRCR